jgi:guanylate kinase
MAGQDQSLIEFVEYLESSYPFSEFLHELETTTLPGILRNAKVPLQIKPDQKFIFIINGVTGSGKDTLLDYLEDRQIGRKATTAVNRLRRPAEPEDKMIWMRQMHADESPATYYQNLINEYDLVEYNIHHNNLYGLPQHSLEQALKEGSAIIRNEPNGARTILKKLNDTYNISVLFLIPDSWTQIFERINTPNQKRDNIRTRLEDSLTFLTQSKSITHYYIHNSIDRNLYQNNSNNSIAAMCLQVEKLVHQIKSGILP